MMNIILNHFDDEFQFLAGLRIYIIGNNMF